MARRESDREDLMREATALKRRIELQLPGERENIVAGFRSDGALSVYFGPDPAYHLDAAGRLRRAFADGRLYRTQGATLARLTRVRTSAATELQREDLQNDEVRRFIDAMRGRLEGVAASIETGTVQVIARVPPDDGSIADALAAAIRRSLDQPQALAPAIKGKR